MKIKEKKSKKEQKSDINDKTMIEIVHNWLQKGKKSQNRICKKLERCYNK